MGKSELIMRPVLHVGKRCDVFEIKLSTTGETKQDYALWYDTDNHNNSMPVFDWTAYPCIRSFRKIGTFIITKLK